jgi:hypothetical protein
MLPESRPFKLPSIFGWVANLVSYPRMSLHLSC